MNGGYRQLIIKPTYDGGMGMGMGKMIQGDVFLCNNAVFLINYHIHQTITPTAPASGCHAGAACLPWLRFIPGDRDGGGWTGWCHCFPWLFPGRGHSDLRMSSGRRVDVTPLR